MTISELRIWDRQSDGWTAASINASFLAAEAYKDGNKLAVTITCQPWQQETNTLLSDNNQTN